MKVRKGFVSNSSSSSFVVAFPKKPRYMEDVKEMLFGDKEDYDNPFDFKAQPSWPSDMVADIVWADIKKQDACDLANIIEALRYGWHDEEPDIEDYELDEGFDYSRYHADCLSITVKESIDFYEKHIKCFIYTFEYSDNDGDLFSAMEHGDLFDRLPYIKRSMH